jgi:hypothetical protein
LAYNATELGVHAYILPYLELETIQDEILRELNVDKFVDDVAFPNAPAVRVPWWTSGTTAAGTAVPSAWAASSPRIPAFVCPSHDPFTNANLAVLHHNYGPENSNSGTITVAYFAGNEPDPGRTTYLGCAGGMGTIPNNGWNVHRGVFGNRTKYGFKDVKDGTNATFLFGEQLGGMTWSRTSENATWRRTHDFANAWIGAATMCTAWGIKSQAPPTGTWTYQRWYQFSSEHPEKLGFVMVDGSVQFLSDSIATGPFRELSSMTAGGTVDYEALGL